MFKNFTRLMPLLLLCYFLPGNAGAQQPNPAPNLNLGDAVATGFSGTIALDPTKPRPPNKSAIDLTFINPDGPSARVIGIGHPGFVWDGRLFQAPKTFDVFAKDTGQVFGVALDDQPAPNIYLAATSAFGLNLIDRGAGGQSERRKVGGTGAGWMKGQFGLDLQGDPGSIYKVDGTTGAVTLFAKVMLDGVPNPGPALGNLAYDAAHKQLFASDLYTGMVHRIAVADGSEPGAPYDHGVTGRGAANLPPVPFNPANRPNISSNKFNAENPDSWGFAPPERRVWGVAVHAGRLFYSARNGAATDGPQIWSVGIAQDGSFAADARLEVEVAAQPGPYSVSDIAFSQKGAMILAQRAPAAASYDYSAFTKPGEPRVLRYWLKDSNDPPSPGLWKPMPEEYAVGFAGTYRNTDGGVALGYGYGPDGMLSGTACEASLWSTGQNLRNNPAQRSQLEPGGPLVVTGLQGSPADMVRSANAPPAISYFIDYDDKFDDPSASGHMGGVRILAQPCAGAVASNVGTESSSSTITPVGSGPSLCTPTCVCPPHTKLIDGKCVGEIYTPSPGATPQNQTATVLCPPPMVPGPAGSCICPPGTKPGCVPQICPPTMVPGPCCPPGMVQENGTCVPGGNNGSLRVIKNVVNDYAAVALPTGLTFQFTVSCGGATFPLSNGGSQTINNIPVGTSCTVSEATPTANICPRGMTPIWSTSFAPPPAPTVIITSGITTVTATNTFNCVKEREGGLAVTKVVSPDPRGIGHSLIFPMTVTCTGTPPVSYTLSVNGDTSTLPHPVPIGDHCTVAEGLMPNLPPGCTWLAPIYSPTTVIIGPGTNVETVTNGYQCRENTGALIVEKKVENHAPKPIPGSTTYPISVTCTAPSNLNVSFSLPDNGSHTDNNIPYTSTCHVVEGTLPLLNVCPPRTTPVWTTNISPNPVTINSPTTTVNVLNILDCKPVPACPPPMVLNVDGICACPTGTEPVGGACVPVSPPPVCPPPQVSNVDGICMCPTPMQPGAIPGSCICPTGTEQAGGKCVTPAIRCPSPMFLNADGKCVKPEPKPTRKREKPKRKQRQEQDEPQQQRRFIDPDRLPGIGIPGLGGGGPRGGGENPGGSPGRR